MNNHKINKLPKGTVEIIVNIPKEDIAKEYEFSFDRLHKDLAVDGFRKGKVPKLIAKKHINNELVYQDVARNIIPKIYEKIIKTENLKPIISPKIELTKAKQNEDWQIKIIVAEKPRIEIANYKELIKRAKDKSASWRTKPEIWVPGKSDSSTGQSEKDKAIKKQQILNDILSSLIDGVKIEISDLIIEEELNRRLTQLVDDIQKIGLTVDAYLKSKNTTMEALRANFKKEIEDIYKLEFLLTEIADKEGIEVKKEDLDKLFSSIPDEKERKTAQNNAYFYAAIARKQKTLDYLMSL